MNPKSFDLTGQVAVVTGGNGGMGRAIALGLASAGSAVAVLCRNAEKNAAVRAADSVSVRKRAHELGSTHNPVLDILCGANGRPAAGSAHRKSS